MGLREKKAQRNWDRIVSEALILFARDGYDQTTMESIAEAAEVSPSTLYRYFPSKDLIILARYKTFSETFAEVFATHSANHPVDEALAQAIFTVLDREDDHREETLLVRSILDRSPIPRARLWDYLSEQEHLLSVQLAERLDTGVDDLRVVLTARLAILIVGTAADRWRAGGGLQSSRSCAEAVMRLFQEQAVILPRPPKKNNQA
jgi:AcrR family transcriptional regulator